MKQIAAIDLFCGVGGLTHGLQKAGINVLAGIDIDNSCKFAFEANNKAKFINADISTLQGKDIQDFWQNNDINVLVGCAPCQPFSTHSNKIKGKEGGNKWNLLNHFIRVVEESSPNVISMENVPNLSNKQIFKDFHNKLIDLGYHVSFSNIYCPDYGIPQKRRRLVLLASKFGKISLLKPTHTESNYVTVKDAIGHLEKIDNGQRSETDRLHFTAKLSDINLKRIRSSKPNGSWEDWDDDIKLQCHKRISGKSYTAVYGRMSWDEPSPTITTQFFSYGTGRFGHPEQDRALTIREALILQTFPDGYKLYDDSGRISLSRLGVHIGNAVPVTLGFIIGKSIINHINNVEV